MCIFPIPQDPCILWDNGTMKLRWVQIWMVSLSRFPPWLWWHTQDYTLLLLQIMLPYSPHQSVWSCWAIYRARHGLQGVQLDLNCLWGWDPPRVLLRTSSMPLDLGHCFFPPDLQSATCLLSQRSLDLESCSLYLTTVLNTVGQRYFCLNGYHVELYHWRGISMLWLSHARRKEF